MAVGEQSRCAGCLLYARFTPTLTLENSHLPTPRSHSPIMALGGPALGEQTHLEGASPSGWGDVPILLPLTARPVRVKDLWV